MKYLVCAILTFACALAQAQGFQMMVAPNSPMVFRADFNDGHGPVVPGPYFPTQYYFNSDREAVVTEIQVVATSFEGVRTEYSMPIVIPLKIHPGVTAYTEIMYFGKLPRSNSFEFDVEAKAVGGYLDRSEPLDATLKFKTQ